MVPPAVGALLLVAGCAPSPRVEDARAAAVEFAGADGSAACQLLAPATREALEEDGPCAEALEAAALPEGTQVVRVELAGDSAVVGLADQTMFLALFDDGWRITAAGCSRVADDRAEPYDCSVKGD